MTIHSYGFGPPESESELRSRSLNLLLSNFELVLKSHNKILNCAEYFFCQPAFSFCSWPFVGGDGMLPLGYLLIGWQSGMLTEPCKICGGNVCMNLFRRLDAFEQHMLGREFVKPAWQSLVAKVLHTRNLSSECNSFGACAESIPRKSQNGWNTTDKFSVGAATAYNHRAKRNWSISRQRILFPSDC